VTSPTSPSCWALSDAGAGNRRQAEALARALGAQFETRCLVLREPWNTFAPRLTIGAHHAIHDASGAPLAPPWPDIAIGCGRRAALATRLLHRWSGGRTFTVQILDPRIDARAFDVVIAPQHDRIRGGNVIASIGALNPVDAAWLAEGRTAFAPLAALPSPRTAVLIGATSRAQTLDALYFRALAERLRAWHADGGGSFLVSTSRRTPSDVVQEIRAAFATLPGPFWSGPDDGPNPYAGFLGWADRIVVTPDSVNMISEACATGKPVYTFAPRPIGGKLAEFHRELRVSGHLRLIDDTSQRPLPPPLRETREIAALVRQRWVATMLAAPDLASHDTSE
jgi:mitochondrial fission protein ELM1